MPSAEWPARRPTLHDLPDGMTPGHPSPGSLNPPTAFPNRMPDRPFTTAVADFCAAVRRSVIPAVIPIEIMRTTRFLGVSAACALLAAGTVSSRAQDATPAAANPPPVVFETHVRPILKAHCWHCHGEHDEKKGNLDARLQRFLLKGGDSGPAVVPGKRAESYLFERVSRGEMPPGDKKLTPAEMETIGAWIDAGAPTARPEPESLTGEHAITPEERAYWAFQPQSVAAPPGWSDPPSAEMAQARIRTPIDAFLHARLRERGLAFNPDADKRTLIQRASFDLTGLPPTPEEVQLFLADTADDAYERLLDRLLASPHYGERWGRHWLDVAGYADSDGGSAQDTLRPYAYKYRDYVIRAFNQDMPLDRFVAEQLAGDELITSPLNQLSESDRETLTATGFLRMGVDPTATADNDELRNQVVADTLKIVSTSLLGLSVGCAQCHDHRYDPILQTDYYRLRAVFEPAYNWKTWRPPAGRLVSLYTDADRAAAAKVAEEAAAVAKEQNEKQAEFMARAFDKELLKFPEEMRPALRAAYQTPAGQRSPEQVKLLADNPSINITPGVLYQYDPQAAEELKKYSERIAEIQAKRPPEDFLQVLTELPGQIPPTYLFHRGDHRQPKEELLPGVLTVLAREGRRHDFPADDPQLPTSGRRLALARWLMSDQNPLTARVLANRVWLHHFGTGIVNTPGDFGRLGELPSHPELLDWLAHDLRAHGWKLKRLHKLIMLSTAYRQSSARTDAGDAADPDGRLLSRWPLQRLDAESLRDRMLAASNLLNRRMFGPAVPVGEDEFGQVVIERNWPPVAEPPPADHPEFRRSIYVQVRRSQPAAILQVFDAPVMEVNCERRQVSTAPTQSLLLMNSDTVQRFALHFAARVRRETGTDPARQVRRVWEIAYLRPPTDAELVEAGEFLMNRQAQCASASAPDPALEALASLCHVVLCSNEFLYVE